MALAIGWVAKNLGFRVGSKESVLGAREGFLEEGETSQALKGSAPVGRGAESLFRHLARAANLGEAQKGDGAAM